MANYTFLLNRKRNKTEKHYKATGKLIQKLMLTMGNTKLPILLYSSSFITAANTYSTQRIAWAMKLCATATKTFYYLSALKYSHLQLLQPAVLLCLRLELPEYFGYDAVVIDVCHGDEDTPFVI